MKLIVTENLEFLRIVEATEIEQEQIQFSLNRRIRGWFFNPLVKKKIWNGYIPFCKNNFIPIGLWMEVVKIGEHFNFPVEITGLERIVDYSFDKEHFKQFCEDFFVDSTFKPRDYQIESAAEILKYRLCSSEIATSAGKTFIVFIIYAYLKSMGKLNKIAIIVPNTTLVMQLKDDWEEYNDGKLKMKVRQVYGGSKDRESDADVIVGTFQSLCKKTLDYYKGVDVVFCDEAHQSSTASVKNVVSKCKDSIYRFGLSGTIKEDDSADFATVTSLLGPLVKTISPKFLFKEGYATPAKFKIIVLKYNDDICEKLSKIKRSKTSSYLTNLPTGSPPIK